MIFGITLDRTNPDTYTIDTLKFWMPQLGPYFSTEDGGEAYKKLYALANDKIFYSIWGTDWEYAMSLCIAHYITMIAKQGQNTNGDTLAAVAAADTYNGVVSSMSVGSFNKTFDLASTLINDADDAKWWNLTSYGAALMALYKTKAAPSIFVVTPTDGAKATHIRPSLNSNGEVMMMEMQKKIAELEAKIGE